jgi:hypothetical protein
LNHFYFVDVVLESVDKAKYLGVTISEDLKWESHINNICGKANKTRGFLRRNLNNGSTFVKKPSSIIVSTVLVYQDLFAGLGHRCLI